VRIGARSSAGWWLLRPTARTIRWSLLLLIVPLGFLMIWSGMRHGGNASVMHLPVAGSLLAAWAGFLLDDAAAETVSNAPTTPATRRVVRIALALPVIALAWVAFVIYGDAAATALTLTAALVAQIAVALAFAAIGTGRTGAGRGGPVAIAGLFVVFALFPLLLKVPWTADPAGDSWHHLYGRWLWIGAIACVAFTLASADPARRGPIARLHRSRTHAPHTAPEAAT